MREARPWGFTTHFSPSGSLPAGPWAALSGGAREPRIVPFRGDYLVLRPEARHLANALVYPVPDPGFPFLGVHTTKRLDGSMWLGPNAVLAFARDGYGRFRVRLVDLWDAVSDPGFLFSTSLTGQSSMKFDREAHEKAIPASTRNTAQSSSSGLLGTLPQSLLQFIHNFG